MYIVKSGSFYVAECKGRGCYLIMLGAGKFPKIYSYSHAVAIAMAVKGKVVKLEEKEI